MKTSSTAKFIGTPSRKVGLVAAAIRGRRASDAWVVLNALNKRATTPVGKVLSAAIANAENNHGMNVADLVIESVLVGPGPTLKRFRPRGKGSASSIRKRSSHITVIVSDGKDMPAKAVESKATVAESTKPESKTAAKPTAAATKETK
jgi:large subunit ribosomal protein L22